MKNKIVLWHPSWNGDFIITGNNRGKVSHGDEADILEFNSNKITLKWDNWGEESFYRDSIEGTETYWFTDVKNVILKKNADKLVIHPFEAKQSAIFHLPYNKIFIKIHQYNFFYFLDYLTEEIKRIIENNISVKEILFFGGCKEAICATILAERINSIFPKIKVGVVAAPVPIDLSNDAPVFGGTEYSIGLSGFRRSKVFRDITKINGDIKAILDNSHTPPAMFGVYRINSRNVFDKWACDRIDKYLYKRLEIPSSDDFCYAALHRGAFSKFRDDRDFALEFFEECFHILNEQ